MINPFLSRIILPLAVLTGLSTLRAEEVIIIQEDFEGGVVEELAFAGNANAILDIADDPAGGDRGKVGVIDLTGGAQWGALWASPEQIVPLAPLGVSPGVDTYVLTADFYLPEDTTMADPDTIGVIARWIDDQDSNANKTEIGNNQAISNHPVGEWFSMEVAGPIPGTLPDGTVTHLRPIISFRDQDVDAGAAAIYVDNIRVTAETTGEDPNLNIGRASPFSTYTDLSARSGSLNVSNSGLTQALNISEAKIQGADSEHFTLLTDVPLDVQPGESATLDISFVPGKGAGSYRAELVLTSNDSSDPAVTVSLNALIIGDTGAELIINGNFEAGSTAGFTSGQTFKTITEPVHGGEFAAVYEFAGGLQWGSVNLDQPAPISPEEGPTNHVRITEEMWGKEWNFSGFFSKPEENAITDEDQAQFIIRWNGVQPDSGPFTSINGASLTAGEWTEYTETGIVPEVWPPEGEEGSAPVTEAYLIFSFRDNDSNAAGGEQIYIDDWSFNIDGIALDPLPGPISITDVALNATERSITTKWATQPGEWFDVSTSTDLQNWTNLATGLGATAEGTETSYTDSELGDDAVRYYRIVRADAPPFLQDGFEDGMGDWTVALFDGGAETATTWEFGTPTNGPAAARSGDNVAGTDLDADYEAGTTVLLRSPLIDTAGETRVGLSFWYYLNALEDEGGQVKLLDANGGDIATLLDPFIGGENGNTTDWTQASVRLPDLSEPFYIEFQFLTVGGNANTGAGWFIDDIRIGK